MKLYTRLIEAGVFIFWNPDEGNNRYILKIRIFNGDNKIELVNLDIPQGQNYFSFDRVGSGDYEIELNGYKTDRLYQTEIKKIKIVSSIQKSEEQTDKVLAFMSHILDKLSSIRNDTSELYDSLSDPEYLANLKNKIEYYRNLYHYWGV